MNILLIILLAIFGLITIIVIIAAAQKDESVIEREVTINKPTQEVFNYIKLLKNQDYYSKWVMMDPNSKKTYTGIDGTVGFISAWESTNKQVGQGEQKITNVINGERLDSELHFMKPFDGISQAWMTTESVSDNQTKVKWGFRTNRKFGMKLAYILMNLERKLGNDFQENLSNLKNVLEK